MVILKTETTAGGSSTTSTMTTVAPRAVGSGGDDANSEHGLMVVQNAGGSRNNAFGQVASHSEVIKAPK